jgi:hypothetical protein
MAEITKLLGIAINDYEAGHVTPEHLLEIFQEAIDNGDILLPDNKLYVVAAVTPLLDRGILKPSQHTKKFEERMNLEAAALLAKMRKQESPSSEPPNPHGRS